MSAKETVQRLRNKVQGLKKKIDGRQKTRGKLNQEITEFKALLEGAERELKAAVSVLEKEKQKAKAAARKAKA